ncbi:MAG: chemotaxis protein CheA [Bryobacteraceae bacterium]|nr:chemotaxis protein CheA [Bryobacteraceae bacterium]
MFEAGNLLRQRVDDLATRLVMGETDVTLWSTLLGNVREQAEAGGEAEVARLAAQAIDKLPSAAAGVASFEVLFSADILALQKAAAGESAPVTAPAPGPVKAPPVALGEDPEMIADFILESREHLHQVEIQMMTLEKDPGDMEAINTVFRGFHTIKGLAGFLDFADIREVAHETETLLDLARNQEVRITSRIVDLVLAAADFLKVWLTRLEAQLAGGDPGPAPETALLLERLKQGATPGESAVAAPATPAVTTAPVVNTAPAASASSVKVDTSKLDALVDMAGEMVIAQAMVRHHPELAALQSPALLRSLAQLARITGEVQKTAMSMRMVPVAGLFQKMNRLVRDLGRKTGKQAEMEAFGAETELDRNVVEELADPLMHMVRNAMDHGLEPPEERRAAGKDPQGRVRLKASHQAGHIVIEIADDGRGLVREKILAKARRTGLVEDGEHLSDHDVFNYIFHPGFSTAAQVTDVSGRGVGMDVVKRQIQKLRGRIDIESQPGQGTSFFLRLPLTLAMIDGLVVGVGQERYVLPIFSVHEVLQPKAEMIFTVEGRQEMAMVRESLLPVVRLYRRLGVAPCSEEAAECLLVVAEAGDQRFCLMVDKLIGKQEVVIKSLGEQLRDTPGVAGGAILGDGRVSLILDLDRIYRLGTA